MKSMPQRSRQFFIQQLLSNGTTAALVFCTLLSGRSVDALFTSPAPEYASARRKVMMDEDTRRTTWAKTRSRTTGRRRALIQRWHHQGRLGYAGTYTRLPQRPLPGCS